MRGVLSECVTEIRVTKSEKGVEKESSFALKKENIYFSEVFHLAQCLMAGPSPLQT